MDSQSSYIRQIFPKPFFSPTITKEFKVTEAGIKWTIDIDYMNSGARLIQLHNIIIDCGSNEIANATLKDNYGNVIMHFNKHISMSGIYPMNFIINSGLVKLTILFTAGVKPDFFATCMYQYIMDEETKGKK